MADNEGRIECAMEGESAYTPANAVQALSIGIHDAANNLYRWSGLEGHQRGLSEIQLHALQQIEMMAAQIRKHMEASSARTQEDK